MPDTPIYTAVASDLRDGEIVGDEYEVMYLVVGDPIRRGRGVYEVPVQFLDGSFGSCLAHTSYRVPVLASLHI